MDRIVSNITDRFIEQLPEERQHYRTEELRSLDIPSFLFRRLRLGMVRNLEESLAFPETEWADVEAEEAQSKWKEFVSALSSQLRLPAGHARNLFESAVSDCLEMLVRPRARIPGMLYGEERELNLAELQKRGEWLVVYPHFKELFPRYMRKKELETLGRDRCEEIVRRADEKMVDGYGPGEWSRMLEPLFQLTGGEADPGLLSLFFEDKGRDELARRFDERDEPVTREEFRRLLEDRKAPRPESGNGHPPEEEGKDLEESREVNDVPEEPAEERVRTASGDEPETQEAEGEPTEGKQAESGASEGDTIEAGEESGELPMWMRYLEPEELQRLQEEEEERLEEPVEFESPEDPAGTEEETDDDTVEEGFIDDPVVDLTGSGREKEEENGDSPTAEKLRVLLKDEKSYFIEEIFRGSERAYEEALEEISGYEEWKSASRYIEKNIFKRNMVDMYSEPAVDFTDRLQSWFLEHSKSN